ncbi:MAG: phage holin family protein [Prevotella sp.]
MFSNDQNIETIGQLVETVKHYIGLQTEYVKLDVIEKVVKLITVVCLTLLLFIILMMAVIYLSFSLAFALESIVGRPVAFLIVAGAHLSIFVLFFLFRKRWIERPLVKFLATLLMEK